MSVYDWEDKDGNKYEFPSHCANSLTGDYYYLSDINTGHQIEVVLNPLVSPLGMAGISAFNKGMLV